MPGERSASAHIRDPEQVKQGGSNLLALGLTDTQADTIWGPRFELTISGIDDANDQFSVDKDHVMDLVIGAKWRLKDSSQSGIFTIASQGLYDSGADETTFAVEESVSAETVSSQTIEPAWVAGGWHKLAVNMQGGSITHERDVSRVFNEIDEEVAEVVSQDEFVIGRTAMENNERFKLLLKWMEDHYFEVRDLLPITSDGEYFQTAGDRYGELRGYPHVSAQKESYEESIASDEQRTHDVTLNATRDPSTGSIVIPSHGARVVNLDEQTGWPSELDPFKDSAYSSSKTLP